MDNYYLKKWLARKSKLVLVLSVTGILAASIMILHLQSLSKRWTYQSAEYSQNKQLPHQAVNLRTIDEVQEPDDNRIFFHETSGRSSLSFRQTCTVESVARNNPTRPVQVYLQTKSELVDLNDAWAKILGQFNNVHVVPLDGLGKYFSGTPLEHWYTEGKWRSSPHRIEHLSDYLRMLTLWKGGGLYMDLDVILCKSLDTTMFWNFLVVPNAESTRVANGILHLQHGHRLIDAIVKKLASSGYDPDNYAAQGPAMLTSVIKEHCNFKEGDLSSNNCHDLNLIPSYVFFPIPFPQWETYFREPDSRILKAINSSYGYHVWNKLSAIQRYVPSNSLYYSLTREHCPLSFSHADMFFEAN